MSIFSNDQQKALRELFIVLEKGINLLANKNLDKDLYEAYEKYANSTIKMVNEAYNPSYLMHGIEEYGYIPSCNIPLTSMDLITPSISPYTSGLHSARNVFDLNPQNDEYREKLKNLLQKLILLAQKVVYE